MMAPGASARVRAALARLPGCALPLMAAAYGLAWLADRELPAEASVLAALLLPLAWLLVQPGGRVCDGLVERWFLLALLLLAWMAGVQALRSDALPAGWIRFAEHGAALSACLAAAAGRVPARAMIAVMGRSAAAVALLAALIDGLSGRLVPYNILVFGFGQLNILTDTAGPALLAWAALLIGDAWQRRPPRSGDLALLLAGAAALGVIALLTQRRGVTLALALAGLFPALAWLWRRQRLLAGAVLALGLLAGAVLLAQLFAAEIPGLRNERIAVYRVALEGVVAGLPWGFGHFGMLHTQVLPGEACRHFAACGAWMQHAHNEFLDIALDGGPVALALALALAAMLVHRVAQVRDAVVRRAFLLAGIALALHLLTDNVFGLAPAELWLGAMVGTMLGAPVAGGAPVALRALPPVRLLAWLFTLPALAGALITLPAAALQLGASPEIRWRCLRASCDPLVIGQELGSLVAGPERLPRAAARAALAQAVGKVGWNGLYAAYADLLARGDDRPAEELAALVRVLAFSPFYRDAYQALAQLIARHPGTATALAPAVQRRLAYLSGTAHLPPPELGAPLTGIEDAADAYAGISWAIANARPWPPIAAALHRLCRRYGDIPGVAQLVLQTLLTAPPGSLPWLEEQLPTITVGARYGFDARAFLAQVTTREQARALQPVLAALYPAGRGVGSGAVDGDPELAKALARVAELARSP